MENIRIQKAHELPDTVRSAVERLLGRSVAPDEEISVVAVPARQIAPSASRAEAALKLEALLNRRAEKVKDIAKDVIDAAIDEAAHHVRHSRS